MIGIVIVSHSEKLAEGVLELASQMTRGSVPMEATGGIDDPDNPIGTDPMKVMMAIESVAAQAEDGVLVLMDLGSALMSAETALDFLPDDVKAKVMLCSAPIVEGTMAAAVQASVGASLENAAMEAATALEVKINQLAPVTGESGTSGPVETVKPAESGAAENTSESAQRIELRILNKMGLHARPAAALVSTAGQFAATVIIRKGDATASAKSINQVALLSVKNGDTISVEADGPDAGNALEAITKLHAENFGERDEDIIEVASQASSGEMVNAPSVGATVHGTLAGVAGSNGFAVGPAYVHETQLPEVPQEIVSDTTDQIARLDKAIAEALDDLRVLQRETEKTAGKANAAIFEAHAMIIGDSEVRDAVVKAMSEQNFSAAYAWYDAITRMADDYRNLDDGYMQARAADVLDAGGRVVRILTGVTEHGIHLENEAVIVAHDLTPSDVAGLDLQKVLGIVTEVGGVTSHAAILARSMGIPAVIGVGGACAAIANEGIVALDGFEGVVWSDPDNTVQEDIADKRAKWLAECEAAKEKGSAPAITRDGKAIMVMGNIGVPADAARVFEYGAEGVGLFRTEFLFQDRTEAPDEEEQYDAYVEAARAMQGHPVIIRTLDIGGDKPVNYLDTPKEDNPFLGERGVRFCMARPELFRTQLRALLRAAAEENIWIMYPMISDAQELAGVRQFQEKVREQLVKEGVSVPDAVKTGIMIEVPAAVAVADKLAALCDFFSIGTNDLTQYVMAADRGNASVRKLCDNLNPAVLRMVAKTCEAAHAAGIEVGMCGELAGNSKAAAMLIGLGLDELSMSGPAIPDVKEAIRSVTLDDCRSLAAQVLDADSADTVRALLG